jgi:hypothetical protein
VNALKTGRILRKLRCGPWRAGQLAKAIHVLQVREASAGWKDSVSRQPAQPASHGWPPRSSGIPAAYQVLRLPSYRTGSTQGRVMSASQATLPTSAVHHAVRGVILIVIAALVLAGVLAGLDGLLAHSGTVMHLAATNGDIQVGG